MKKRIALWIVAAALVALLPGAAWAQQAKAKVAATLEYFEDSSGDFEVRDAAGGPLTGRQLALKIDGARAEGPPKEDGKGAYLSTLSTSGNGPIDLVATVTTREPFTNVPFITPISSMSSS